METNIEKKLTQSLEDYLETLLSLSQTNRVIRVRDIAQKLNVKPSSVTSALKKLTGLGLVTYTEREFIYLTQDGIKMAEQTSNKHSLIFKFLRNILGVSQKNAENDACNMEHYLSKETITKMKASLKKNNL